MSIQVAPEKLTPWLSHNPQCASNRSGPSVPCDCGYNAAADRLKGAPIWQTALTAAVSVGSWELVGWAFRYFQ